MRDTLRKIGVSEAEFLRSCDASFKQGTHFVGWHNGQDDAYFHPFSPPNGYPNLNLAEHWQGMSNWRRVSVTPSARKSASVVAAWLPKKAQTPEYAFELNYGYHLNAGKFVDLLQRHCVEKLGVEHQLGHVQRDRSGREWRYRSARTRIRRAIAGDLFIDCTGFAAILIGKHYKVPFVSQRTVCSMTRRWRCRPSMRATTPRSPRARRASAQSSGWIWDIALPTRRGIGHVFSSRHTTLEMAEEALANYIKAEPDLAGSQPAPRKIEFRPGHRETFWHRNCVAVGVSAGFVEPLEASALVLIEKSAEWISEQLPRTRDAVPVVAKRFNEITRQHWHTIIDFLKLHYVLSERSDSEYWRDHRRDDSIPESLQESLLLWRSQVPWLYETNDRIELFSSASIQFVLYGMHFHTDVRDGRYRHWRRDSEIAKRLIQENRAAAEALVSSLPTNRELLDRVRKK